MAGTTVRGTRLQQLISLLSPKHSTGQKRLLLQQATVDFALLLRSVKLVVSHPLSDAISQRTRDYMRDAVKQHLPVSRPPSSDTHTFPIVSSRYGLPLLHPPLGSSGCSVTAKQPLLS